MLRTMGALMAGAFLWSAAQAGPLAGQAAAGSRIIDMHVNAEASNVSIAGSVLEGGRFRLTVPSGEVYELSPVVTDEARQQFRVTVLRAEGSGEAETFKVVETVQATRGVPAPLKSIPYVTLVIERVRLPQTSQGAPAIQFLPASYARGETRSAFQDRCCVTCSGWTVCACAVKMDCGRCCIEGCCDVLPASGALLPAEVNLAGRPARGCRPVADHERVFTRRKADGTVALRG